MIKENLELLDRAQNFRIKKEDEDHYCIESKNTSLIADIYLYGDFKVTPYKIEYGISNVRNYGYDVANINMTDLESLKSFCEFLVKE